jgi:hypothetical protein
MRKKPNDWDDHRIRPACRRDKDLADITAQTGQSGGKMRPPSFHLLQFPQYGSWRFSLMV